MQRRIVSIAFYLNGIVLALLLVLQAAHGLFPSIQIQYWPVAISVVFLLSAFLWRGGSDGQGRVRESVWLRVTALAACLLSPFVCWYASLTSHGVPFIPVFNHLYLQVMGILALEDPQALRRTTPAATSRLRQRRLRRALTGRLSKAPRVRTSREAVRHRMAPLP